MRKLTVLAIAFVAIAFAACGGKKTQAPEQAQEEKSFEQAQIEASIKMHLDSISAQLSELPQLPFLTEGEGGLSLTKEEKQVKPDYLLSATVADEATTLSEKYRILSALNVDKKIAAIYEMPVEDYDKAIAKLVAEVNDPAFKDIADASTIFETSQTLYGSMEQNGRINYFWQLAAATIVEQLYIINQNSEKFLSVFDDKAAESVTFRIVVIIDAINRLAQYDPEVKPVAEAIAPLSALNATSVDELKTQLEATKENVAAVRAALIK